MKKSNLHLFACFGLIIVSLALFYPGITEPMLTISLDSKIDANVAKFDVNLLQKTQSVWETILELYRSGNALTGHLILLFSIIVPLFKASGLLFCLATRGRAFSQKFYGFIQSISKWSMADVFVVAVFIAYLSTRDEGSHVEETLSFMGFKVPLHVEINMHSTLENGFMYFLSYCLVSIASLHLISRLMNSQPSHGSDS